jgi:hypothetical protein
MPTTHILPDSKLAPVIKGTLSTNDAVSIDLDSLGRVEAWRLTNTHGSAVLYYEGHGGTATVAASDSLAAGESSGWIFSQDSTLSLIRAEGAEVTYKVQRMVPK